MSDEPRPLTGLTRWSRITLLLTATLVLIAMVPCLGWLNWGVAPLCLAPTTLGIIGAVKRGKAPELTHPGPFLAAIIGGLLMLVASVARLVIGLGVM
jgi:hypothetical protein